MVVIRESNKEDDKFIERLTSEANKSLRKIYRPTKQTLAKKDNLTDAEDLQNQFST